MLTANSPSTPCRAPSRCMRRSWRAAAGSRFGRHAQEGCQGRSRHRASPAARSPRTTCPSTRSAARTPPSIDDEMVEAVRAFQINHGVLPSGMVAEKTLAELNVPAETRLGMLRENLPRVEAYAQGLRDYAILVNIPAAQLETVEIRPRLFAPQHRGGQARAALADAGQQGERHQLQSLLEDPGLDRRARHRAEIHGGPELPPRPTTSASSTASTDPRSTRPDRLDHHAA